MSDHNNITFAGDYAQSINLGASAHNPLRSSSDEMKKFLPKRLTGSFRLPMRISECLVELSKNVNQKYTAVFGIDANVISPYKGAPQVQDQYLFMQKTLIRQQKKLKKYFLFTKRH